MAGLAVLLAPPEARAHWRVASAAQAWQQSGSDARRSTACASSAPSRRVTVASRLWAAYGANIQRGQGAQAWEEHVVLLVDVLVEIQFQPAQRLQQAAVGAAQAPARGRTTSAPSLLVGSMWDMAVPPAETIKGWYFTHYRCEYAPGPGTLVMHEAPTSDGDRGLALLALFIAAMLLDVTGVWVLSALGGWWLLALAIAIHLLMICLVLGAVTRVVGDQGGSAEARDPRPARSERPPRNAAPAP